jgi:predicted DNA-binding transcriptional regulator AlpA
MRTRYRDDRLLREGELSALIGVSIPMLRKWRSQQRRRVRSVGPPWLRLSRKGVRYSLREVEAWLAKCSQEAMGR